MTSSNNQHCCLPFTFDVIARGVIGIGNEAKELPHLRFTFGVLHQNTTAVDEFLFVDFSVFRSSSSSGSTVHHCCSNRIITKKEKDSNKSTTGKLVQVCGAAMIK